MLLTPALTSAPLSLNDEKNVSREKEGSFDQIINILHIPSETDSNRRHRKALANNKVAPAPEASMPTKVLVPPQSANEVQQSPTVAPQTTGSALQASGNVLKNPITAQQSTGNALQASGNVQQNPSVETQYKQFSSDALPVRVAPLPSNVQEYTTQPAAFGPSTERMQYRVRYPDYEESIRNIMDPIPLPNNPQLYPFMMTIPMEGGDLLRVKEIEMSVSQNYIDGKMEGKSTQYQVNMDQWYLEQNFVFSMGLPSNTQAGITLPLYHFKGHNIFTQNGVEMMGMGTGSRNFWGGPVLNVKHQFYESKQQQFKVLCSGYFQFPEGNQRARGGTTSGHWALNTILEKSFERERLHLNFGLTQPGDLKLLNNTVLHQETGWFIGAGLSHKLTPTLAVEGQLHVDQSALQYTEIADLDSPNVTTSLGLRKQWRKNLDASAAAFKGFDDLVLAGFTLDLRYHW